MVTSSLSWPEEELRLSILDTDLYKLTMQNAVLEIYPDSMAEYKFTNRSPDMLFSRRTAVWVQEQVQQLSQLRLTDSERSWLESNCPYFSPKYLDFLSTLQLHPDTQVEVSFVPAAQAEIHGTDPNVNLSSHDSASGKPGVRQTDHEIKQGSLEERGLIEMKVAGGWVETILYEVPLMAILSEGYFKFDDTDWVEDYQAVEDVACSKALRLMESSQGNLAFSEFGARRRRSLRVQDHVVRGLIRGDIEYRKQNDHCPGGLVGTSNVYLAMRYNLRPIGTIAHEWIMAFGAKYQYDHPNIRSMDAWESVYPSSASSPLHTMLTDTYTIQLFFDEFTSDPHRAMRWNSLRHDSGDPTTFAQAVKEGWKVVADKLADERGLTEESEREALRQEVLGKKRVIFSDSLTVDNSLEIWKTCKDIGIAASFGIGTHFTNDFTLKSDPQRRSKPLNIVIKLKRIDGLECVKLTDDRGKFTGEKEEVRKAIQILGLQDVKKV